MAQSSRGQDAHRDTPAGALPQVRVLLPDGRVTGRLVRRWQAGDGTWVYRVALRGWSSRAASTGQDLGEDLIEIEVPGEYVRPVPGASYDAVPALRATGAPAPQPDAEPSAGSPEAWIGERLRAAPGDPDGRGPGVRFHAPGCWAIKGPTGGTLTAAQARHMVRTDPIAQACDVCGAHKALADGE
ncbi:DUF6233 domain-containing protein [Streptomyces sp. NPDC058665]|uniref:DUF6233 domain-containing protein n=1 Tax=Streptomyces sp. NPDC058665 TaxID=3346586 RepID=UPI00364F0C73